MTRREVLSRDENETEMRVATDGEAKAFAKQLIRAGKGFRVTPYDDGSWTFLISEYNWPTRWEDH